MPILHVCPLSRLAETVASSGASHLVTLVNVGTPVVRPSTIAAEHHHIVGMSDITVPLDGHILPGQAHVAGFLEFVRGWDRARPLVIHCYAGISRSTAAAYTAACALAPERDEAEIADALRLAAPSATPNALFVSLADELLARGGRMSAAITAIGRGAEAFEGTPFRLALA